METENNFIKSTSGITMKDKLGYALGDVGSLLVFGLVNTILQIYYTDYLGIAPIAVMVIFMVARIWDAVNDPIWGGIVDRLPVRQRGTRYKRWLVWLCVPLSVFAVLMFVDVSALPSGFVVAYAAVTYLIFGMLYTGVNIPYGSMSSVVTTDDRERNSLSVFRSVGSTLGGFGALILYMLCYSSVTNDDGTTSSVFNYTILLVGVIILAVLSCAAFIGCNKLSKERVESVPPRKEKGERIKVIKGLMGTRSFLVISIVGLLFLAAQMFQTSYNTYLFKYYFEKPGWASLVTICQYLPVAVVMFFSGKLVKKFGRKEICALGVLLAGLAFLVLCFWRTDSAVVYLAFCLVSGIGFSFIFLMIWALANDAIDDYIVRSGRADHGTAYALFTFMRKLGQTLAAIVVNVCLISMGYGSSEGIVVTDAMATSMYLQAVLVPCIMCFVMFILLWFAYPLSKKKVMELQDEKNKVMNEIVNEAQSEETLAGEGGNV